MSFSMAELPLALFTTLAPAGAGAFIVLACASFQASFDQDAIKKMGKASFLAIALVIIGFICAFFHLASPLNAAGVLSGAGSPLSNEVITGCIFTLLALVYVICACAGKLQGTANKVFVLIVALGAIVFALFTAAAYMIQTIPSWNTPFAFLQLLGFCLVGGAATGALVLICSGAWESAIQTSFKTSFIALGILGFCCAVIGIAGQLGLVSGLENATSSGAELMNAALTPAIAGLVFLGISLVCVLFALRKKNVAWAGLICALVGIFLCRMAFYAMQISVGIYYN